MWIIAKPITFNSKSCIFFTRKAIQNFKIDNKFYGICMQIFANLYM